MKNLTGIAATAAVIGVLFSAAPAFAGYSTPSYQYPSYSPQIVQTNSYPTTYSNPSYSYSYPSYSYTPSYSPTYAPTMYNNYPPQNYSTYSQPSYGYNSHPSYNSAPSYGYNSQPAYSNYPSYGNNSYPSYNNYPSYNYGNTSYNYPSQNYYSAQNYGYGPSRPDYDPHTAPWSNYYTMYPQVPHQYTGDSDAFGAPLCDWAGYGRSDCSFDPHQWVYDPYSGTWY